MGARAWRQRLSPPDAGAERGKGPCRLSLYEIVSVDQFRHLLAAFPETARVSLARTGAITRVIRPRNRKFKTLRCVAAVYIESDTPAG